MPAGLPCGLTNEVVLGECHASPKSLGTTNGVPLTPFTVREDEASDAPRCRVKKPGVSCCVDRLVVDALDMEDLNKALFGGGAGGTESCYGQRNQLVDTSHGDWEVSISQWQRGHRSTAQSQKYYWQLQLLEFL